MDLRSRLQSLLDAEYTIERELGGGGMSRVFVATERRLGRRVVIKVLTPELSAALSAERFEREIQLAASMQQANIVPVLTAGQVDGHPYYTMPFVEGESLRGRLARGPFSESETLGILRDVARALVYAHERGVVHRDIKPDNVLLSGEAAVVTDFGIAKAITAARTQVEGGATGAITKLGTAIGTPAYMAPEQASGDPHTDHRADLYAFGCLAFELLAGEPPFAGLAPHKLMMAHLAEEPPLVGTRREGVNRTLEELIARCLAKSPDERPPTARETLRILESAASGAASAALPSSLSGRQWSLPQALGIWGATLGATWILARAAVVGIGLPSWTVPLAVIAAGLGLPAVLLTWWVQRSARDVLLRTPTRTPGGTVQVSTMATIALRAVPHLSWKRTWTAGALSALGVVVAIAVVMILRLYGIGPAASLLAAGRIGADSRVLVAEFASSVADTSLGSVVAQAMRTSLAQSKAVSLVSASEVARGLARMTLPPSARLTEQTAREMATRDGIALVVSGQVAAAGNGFLVTARLVSADSGIELASLQRGANGAGDLLDAIDRLARDLRSRIGESLRTVQRAPALAQATTSSLAALREYSRAVQLGDVQGDQLSALAPLEAAVREDSTFAEGWRKLGVYRSNLSMPISASFDAVRQAYQFRSRLSGSERANVESYYLGFISTRQSLQALVSNPAASGVNLAVALRWVGEFAAAESVGQLLLRRSKGRTPIIQVPIALVVSQLPQGKLAEAREALATLRRDFPGAYFTESAEVGVAWAIGGVDSLPPVAARMRRSPDLVLRSEGARLEGVVAGTRGQLRRYAASSRTWKAVTDSVRGTDAVSAAGMLGVIVTSAVDLGTETRAVRQVDSLLASNPVDRHPILDWPGLEGAAAYAQLGRPDKARPLIAEFLKRASRTEQLVSWASLHAALGEVALADGKAQDALREFTTAAQADSGRLEQVMNGRTASRQARALDKLGQPDSAIASYEVNRARLLHQSVNYAPLVLPGTLRRLGELYEARGEFEKAATRYEEFVRLWKDADAELQPQVTEIRQRIQRLRSAEARKR